jgi:parallel beta-helix repeat protein
MLTSALWLHPRGSVDNSQAPPPVIVGPAPAFNPTTGITLQPGDNIQSAVNNNPINTTFWLKAGVYQNQSVTPKDGNTFWGEYGTVLDGGNTIQQAFFSTADNVTIKNMEVRNYVPPFSNGAIRGDWNASNGWINEHLDVHNCFGAGIYASHGSQVRYCNIHHNGQIGMLGWAENAIIENNEIAFNNTNNNPGDGEAGGVKIFFAANCIFRLNNVHNNNGVGIWFDIYNYNCTIEHNTSTDNSWAGIMYEISYNGIIRYNTVLRNAPTGAFTRAGIYISSSPNCEVYGNTLDGNGCGIIGQVASRTRSSDPTFDRGPVVTTGLYVHDNTTNLTHGTTGLIDQLGDGSIFSAASNNRFQNNHYTVNGISKPFSGAPGSMTWTQWQAAGYDINGTLS